MNYLDLMGKAQGGKAYENLGNRFSLSADQTVCAARLIVPALSRSVSRNAASREGLSAILGALGSGQHERYYDDPEIFMDNEARKDGDGILENILENSEIRSTIVKDAARQTGINATIIDQMMPYFAMMYMASMVKRTRAPLDNLANSLDGKVSANKLQSFLKSTNGNIFGALAGIVDAQQQKNISLAASASGAMANMPDGSNVKNGVNGFLGSIFERK